MARRLNLVQHRHHHTWPWAAGVVCVAILSLVGGCGGGDGGGAMGNAHAPNDQVSNPQAPNDQTLEASAPPSPAADTVPLALEPIPSPADTLISANRLVRAKARRLVVPADPVAVDFYTLDDTCDGYQIEPIQVPRPQSMENTVDLILAEQVIPELVLSGYRTSFDPDTKTVTIDLRVARNSRRVLQSLSVCEQRALLGSLRETLLNQPDWKIEVVTFTNRGNPLAL